MTNVFSKEIWKEIFIKDALDTSLQRIYVSDFGRVRIRNIEQETFRFAITKTVKNYAVFVYKTKFGTKKTFPIHRAVAIAFVNKKDQNYDFVVHKDFNNQNNYYKNLMWLDLVGLKKYHVKKKNDKLYNIGKYRKNTNKLTIHQVKEIKQKLKNNKKYGILTDLAKQYNVSVSQIRRIKLGKNWSNIND